jgi:hypothetical protein
MYAKHKIFVAGLILILGVACLSSSALRTAADSIPDRISDRDFWKMTEDFSEPNGYFRSDNLLSNEIGMQMVIPDLIRGTKPGGAYLGVGPEQNFAYIAALKPKIAFITDIRRGNLHTHLMYKALFELSSDRADFAARLFTKKRPEGLKPTATVQAIFDAIWVAPSGDEAAFKENLKAIQNLLTAKHSFPISKEDLEGIEYVYRNFYEFGPAINYNSTGNSIGGGGRGRGRFVSYADLMTTTDGNGIYRGFLANDENFRLIKGLEERNLIVPLVGNFSGPKALRSVAKYLKEHNSVVAAFYLSNVEQYLGEGSSSFCANVANLPLDDKSTFIRSSRGMGARTSFARGGLSTSLGNMRQETQACAGK